MRGANCAAFSASQITVTAFLYLDISIKSLTGYHLIVAAGVALSLSVLSLNFSPSPTTTNTHICPCLSLFFSGRFSQTTGQFSSPHFLIENRGTVSEHEFPVTPPCVSGQLVYSHNSATVEFALHGTRPTLISYPGGSSLEDLHLFI